VKFSDASRTIPWRPAARSRHARQRGAISRSARWQAHCSEGRQRRPGVRSIASLEAIMKLTRWDPLRELDDLSSRLSRVFAQPLSARLAGEGDTFADWAPAIDVQETDSEYLVKADLPEVKKDDVKISVQEGVLAVEGERQQEKQEKGKTFHRIERSYGKFVRRLSVPTDVDQQKVSAEFKDGVLNVHLPKSPSAKPRTIDIKVS
jgi:HSP20 family protein